MDAIKLLSKNKNSTGIYSQDKGMKFGKEKCAMLIMRSGKWQMT